MKARADREACIGAGVCTTFTDVFRIDDDDGKVRVLRDGELHADELDGVEDAIAMCPVAALSLVEDEVS